jgi:DNA-binding CsgD family transcriptional regulator
VRGWQTLSAGIVGVMAVLGCSIGEAPDSPVEPDASLDAWDTPARPDVRSHSRSKRADALGALTAREAQIVTALGEGRTCGEVAYAFAISRRTVESHVASAYRKLGVHSRAQLVRLLARQGRLGL